MDKIEKNVNAGVILFICSILLVTLLLQFFLKSFPCSLCVLERLSLLGMICGGLLNLRFSIQLRHYLITLFFAFMGGSAFTRQFFLQDKVTFVKFEKYNIKTNYFSWEVLIIAFVIGAILIFMLVQDFRKNPFGKNMAVSEMTLLSNITFYVAMGIIFLNMLFLAFHISSFF